MNDPKQALVDKLKTANNILVTVSANPSVDQLAACIGLTIFLNKLKKHATAVFSGEVPSTIEFLKPGDTLEKNTDSLRDFIISLDKAKADKLRYKVEENVVKIFITPYRTSLSADDLDFSQGDFNVDVVLALGVHEQQDLDQAITSHGRILHDAVVMSVNTAAGAELGSINWTEPTASSLSELVVELADALDKDQMDSQIATAMLTGIVAETARFSNEKTSPLTMKLSAELLTAGANQQLVASELQQPERHEDGGDQNSDDSGSSATPTDGNNQPEPPKSGDGTLEINHQDAGDEASGAQDTGSADGQAQQPQADDSSPFGDVRQNTFDVPTGDTYLPPSQLTSPRYISEPPAMGGELTANSQDQTFDEPAQLPSHEPELPILNRDNPASTEPAEADNMSQTPEPAMELPTPVAESEASPSSLPAVDDFLPLESEPEVVAPTIPPAPAEPMQMPVPPSQPAPFEPLQMPVPPAAQTPPAPAPLSDNQSAPQLQPYDASASPAPTTLSDLEAAVHSPHVRATQPTQTPADDNDDSDLDAARDAVLSAINSAPQALPPKEDVGASGYLNVQELPDITAPDQTGFASAPLPPEAPVPTAAAPLTPYVPEPTPGTTPADTPLTMPLPPTFTLPTANPVPPTTPPAGPSAPPPVPPPMYGQ